MKTIEIRKSMWGKHVAIYGDGIDARVYADESLDGHEKKELRLSDTELDKVVKLHKSIELLAE